MRRLSIIFDGTEPQITLTSRSTFVVWEQTQRPLTSQKHQLIHDPSIYSYTHILSIHVYICCINIHVHVCSVVCGKSVYISILDIHVPYFLLLCKCACVCTNMRMHICRYPNVCMHIKTLGNLPVLLSTSLQTNILWYMHHNTFLTPATATGAKK